MGYATQNVTCPERTLTDGEMERGVCDLAGHSIVGTTQRWNGGGGVGRGGIRYCRRCVVGLVCKHGHDLTNPANVGSQGACKVCRNIRNKEFHARLAETRQHTRLAREAFRTKDIQAVINTTGPAPRWLTSGWPPREVLNDGGCGRADARLFDPIGNKTEDHDQELPMRAEARLARAGQVCAGCPVMEQCRQWATDRYLMFGEKRVAGGMYFGPRKSVRFANDSRLISSVLPPEMTVA